MRLRVGDPGSLYARVFLDGVERTYVIEADEENRFIVRYRTDGDFGAQGFVENESRDDILTERLSGDVRIIAGQ